MLRHVLTFCGMLRACVPEGEAVCWTRLRRGATVIMLRHVSPHCEPRERVAKTAETLKTAGPEGEAGAGGRVAGAGRRRVVRVQGRLRRRDRVLRCGGEFTISVLGCCGGEDRCFHGQVSVPAACICSAQSHGCRASPALQLCTVWCRCRTCCSAPLVDRPCTDQGAHGEPELDLCAAGPLRHQRSGH